MTVRRIGYGVTTTTVVNTTTETTLETLTMPGGGLGVAGAAARAILFGDLLNNDGADRTYQFRFKLNSTTILDTGALTVEPSASRRLWRYEVHLVAETDQIQRVGGHLEISGAGGDTYHLSGVGYATAAEDGTSAVNFVLTAQMGTASANLDIRQQMAILESIR